MPNDMSHPPSLSDANVALGLASRTSRYCERAVELASDPALKVSRATHAMEHLAALQTDLAAARSRASLRAREELRLVADDFQPLEAQLSQARVDMSNALLRAKPEGDIPFGLQPHGVDYEKFANGSVRHVSACRALLDLEALRPYLSDDALRQAIETHSRETGQHDLPGVAYALLPTSAHLPCEVI